MKTRYLRQIRLPEIGEKGQENILRSCVTLVGCGALGTVAAEILVRAGVGHIKIIDRDVVELTNLQRQSLFDESDARESRPKALAAARHLCSINSEIVVDPEIKDLNRRNAEELLCGSDLILDGTDNFETRFLVNEVSLKHRIPWIYGGAVGSRGMAAFFESAKTPCFQCLLNVLPPAEDTPTCETAGVFGPIIHWVASLGAGLALRWLSNSADPAPAVLYALDIWRTRVDEFPMKDLKAPGKCPACEEHRYPHLAGETGQRAKTLCGRNAVQLACPDNRAMDIRSLGERLKKIGEVTQFPAMIKFRSGADELLVFEDGRTIVQGTTDVERAKTLLAKYIGV